MKWITRLLALCILGLGNGLWAQSDTLLYVDFDRVTNPWSDMETATDRFKIEGGRATWQHIGKQTMNFWMSRTILPERDFSLEARFKPVKGYYGLCFGGSDGQNIHEFICGEGEFHIFSYKGGVLSNVVTPTETKHFRKKGWQQLKLARKGQAFEFYLNDKLLYRHEAGFELFGNFYGIATYGDSEFEVDDVVLRQSRPPIRLAKDIRYPEPPENLGSGVNTIYDELQPIVTPDGKGLYICRYGDPGNIGGGTYSDVYFSSLQGQAWGPARNLGFPVNNAVNNSVVAVTPDGNRLILLNNYTPTPVGSGGIATSVRGSNGQWMPPQPMPIENYYTYCNFVEFHLGPDGRTLVMSLERHSKQCMRDIYVSFLQANGRWSEPRHLGNKVNTPGNESSPFLAADNRTLYFASDGHGGYGDSDIFMTKRLDDSWTNWSEPVNLGKPINSAGWDAYYSVPASGEYAYFASSQNSLGKGDIFRIKLPQGLRPEPVVLVRGQVFDAKTKQPIAAEIQYERLSDGKSLGQALSDPQEGRYQISLPYGEHYGFRATAKGYLSLSEELDLSERKEYAEITRDLYLTPIEKDASIRLNNVFFERSKAVLLNTSYSELNRLVVILKENPGLEIQIEGHTDGVGNPDANLRLSNERVEAVRQYLIDQGIHGNRIKGKGFGGSRPIAPNDTEANKMKNRRVEFRVLSLGG